MNNSLEPKEPMLSSKWTKPLIIGLPALFLVIAGIASVLDDDEETPNNNDDNESNEAAEENSDEILASEGFDQEESEESTGVSRNNP